jgi:hypothetical protein
VEIYHIIDISFGSENRNIFNCKTMIFIRIKDFTTSVVTLDFYAIGFIEKFARSIFSGNNNCSCILFKNVFKDVMESVPGRIGDFLLNKRLSKLLIIYETVFASGT